MQKDANLVELEKCCQTHIFLQNFVLIQPRTSPPKICKNLQILLVRHPAAFSPSLATDHAGGAGFGGPGVPTSTRASNIGSYLSLPVLSSFPVGVLRVFAGGSSSLVKLGLVPIDNRRSVSSFLVLFESARQS